MRLVRLLRLKTCEMTTQLPNSQTTRLILASASEWRARLLKEAGIVDFDIISTDLDESPYMQSIHDPELLVKTLAEKKVEVCFQLLNKQTDIPVNTGTNTDKIILAADTIVWANQQIIGKPIDRQDAKRIITLLAGTTHEVWTGVCIIKNETKTTFAEKTGVTFKPMSESEIEVYLDTNDWVGKAGAYQYRRNIHTHIDHIDGDEANIIGLPQKTIQLL